MGICVPPRRGNKNDMNYRTINPETIGVQKEFCGENQYIKIKQITEASKAICKISIEMNGKKGHATGFFMKVLLSNNIYRFLVTNYHVISEQLINKKIEIELHNKETVYLKLDLKNIHFFDGQLDVTVIQISDDLYEILEIVDFLDCDMNYLNGYDQYKNQGVFALGYPFGQEIVNSVGKISEINVYEFCHNIATDRGSSGSPVLLLNNSKLIGIHKQGNYIKEINEGTFIGIIIDKLKNQLMNNNNYIKPAEAGLSDPVVVLSDSSSINKGNISCIKKDIREVNFIKDIPDKKRKDSKSGERYEGGFKNGLKEGKGVEYYSNGERFEGYFRNGLREGKGKYIWKNGDKYEGDFKKGKREGNGIMYYKNGSRYEGEFKNGKPEGKGIYNWNEGRYEGDFKNGKREGKGKIDYKNGNIYEGDFKNDIPEGKGKFFSNNGYRYEGDYKNGQPEGKGIAYYNNGDKYEGIFKNGKPEGKGKYYMITGNKYEGDFRNGKPEGKGIMYFKNGDRYVGDYKNGKPEGNGIMHHKKDN